MSVFGQNHKILEMEIFAFCVISFQPIRIQIHYECENDHLNLSFVKDGKKVDRNGCKMAIYESVLFRIRLYSILVTFCIKNLQINCIFYKSVFSTKVNPRGASVHRINKLSTLKSSLEQISSEKIQIEKIGHKQMENLYKQ